MLLCFGKSEVYSRVNRKVSFPKSSFYNFNGTLFLRMARESSKMCVEWVKIKNNFLILIIENYLAKLVPYIKSGMNKKKEKNHKKRNSLILGICLLVLALLLVIFIPCPSNSQYIFFRTILSASVGGIATIIPGFLNIEYRNVVAAGGGLAVMVFMYIYNPVLIDHESNCNEPFDFTIFIENLNGQIELKNKGYLIIQLENDKRRQPIDHNGSVTFRRIPFQFKNKKQNFLIELVADGWQFINERKKTEVFFNGINATLQVIRDNSLCCVFGTVRDEKNNFLPNVTVRLNDIVTITDNRGWFEIKIPHEKQKEVQKLTAQLDGYLIWEANISPGSKEEIQILLK